MSSLEVVNAVGSGFLGVELDLEQVAADIDASIAEYDPEKYPGLYIRLDDNTPLITVYRTGKYIITGGDSIEETRKARERFLSFLAEGGIIDAPTDSGFSMQNFVCVGELTEVLDLSALAIGLGLEQTEYEPEQFPGLVYRPQSSPAVALIFSSGKVVVTGAPSEEVAESTFAKLKSRIAELSGSSG